MKKYYLIFVSIILIVFVVVSYVDKPNVILIVSNQSFKIDPVDLMIIVDSDTVVQDTFFVGNQHNWKVYKLDLSKGYHTIKAKTKIGEFEIKDSFLLFYKKYIYIDYWFYPEDFYDPMPRQIIIEKSNFKQTLM